MTTEVAVASAGSILSNPMQQVEIIKQRYEAIKLIRKELMQEGVHYGRIGLTGDEEKDKNKKPTLLKPGAEVLCAVFGFEPEMELVDKIEDWDNPTEVFLMYRFKFTLRVNGRVAGVGEGSCNSKEIKYRYRGGGRECPACGGAYIRRSSFGDNPGWYCAERVGGCGAKYDAEDQAITGQVAGRTLNPDIPEQANAILKMAQKRGFIAATLMAAMASEFFTQDLEDFTTDDEGGDAPPSGSRGQQRSGGRSGQRSAAQSDKSQQQPRNGQQTASQPQPEGSPAKISEPQRKRFYAIAKQGGKSDDEIKRYVKGYGFDRTDDITTDKYEEMIRWAHGAALDPQPASQPQPQQSAPAASGPPPLRRGNGQQPTMFDRSRYPG